MSRLPTDHPTLPAPAPGPTPHPTARPTDGPGDHVTGVRVDGAGQRTDAIARRPMPSLVRGAAVRLATRGDRGQATAEYGLIILAAGGIALGVIAWATGTGTFTDLFESVVDKLSENL